LLETLKMLSKIALIFGTRPETIKFVPILHELNNYKKRIKPIIIVTAQHREMLDQLLHNFNINPDYDLNIMKQSQTLSQTTINTISKLEPILSHEKPDLILVQGDTTTTFAASLSAFYQKIPVGHIEAGLRTFNKYEPYPEEMNRSLTTLLSTIHFAPTQNAKKNLLHLGVNKKNIFVNGNTVIDTLFLVLKQKYDVQIDISNYNSKNILLVTAHRRENFGSPLKNICNALSDIVKRNSQIEIIYPVHKNPHVRETVFNLLSGKERIHLIDPLDYIDFVNLMAKSYLILTDSGGIQEEAPSLGKPVLVLRNITERPEAVEKGTVKIVGTNRKKIVESTEALIKNKSLYNKMAKAINPYGDGKASNRIVKVLLYYLGL
jgi:UDP-N-acetylglucosamine 2-epimerase (non-hydrolysing)